MNDIFVTLWWLYFCTFFSNYLIVYAIVVLIAKNKNWNSFIRLKIYPLLPLAYALVSTCFWIMCSYRYGFNYISKTIMSGLAAQLLVAWSISGMAFWIPVFRKRNCYSVFHSLPFFILPLVSIGSNIYRTGVLETTDMLNLLRICVAGLFIYAAALIILIGVKYLRVALHAPKHHAI